MLDLVDDRYDFSRHRESTETRPVEDLKARISALEKEVEKSRNGRQAHD